MVKWKHIIILLILILLDQLTKFYFKGKNFFIFNYTQNTGSAFSLFSGLNAILIVIGLIILILLIYFYFKTKGIIQLSLLLIITGTISNLIDRIFLGFVRDFIDFKIWPIFNLADSLIVIGVILILLKEFKIIKKDLS